MLARQRELGDSDGWPVFPNAGRDGAIRYRPPSTVRRSFREHVSLDWMTEYASRRIYGTILDDEITSTDPHEVLPHGPGNLPQGHLRHPGDLHPGAAVSLDSTIVEGLTVYRVVEAA